MNQIVLFRAAMVILGALAIGFLVAGLCITPGVESAGRQAAADQELVELLQRLRATRDTQARARVLRDGRRQGRLATVALRRILQSEEHALLAEAIEYAGVLGVAELRPDVAAWAERGAPEVRAAAVLAAEELAPWDSNQLAGLLETNLVPIQLAVVDIATRRPDVPWSGLFALLSRAEPVVQRAVVRLVPEPTAEAAAGLRDVLGHDASEVVIAGLTVLARTELIDELEVDVTRLVRDLDPKIQAAALACLAAKGTPVADAEAILAVAGDEGAEAEIRARALHCLERTGTDLGELGRDLESLDPLLQYFAARCLVSAGRPEGGLLLVELVNQSTDAAAASRQLLAALTQLSPSASADEFRRSLRERPLQAGTLPPPGVTF